MKKFDVIIGNPPFQDGSNKSASTKLYMRFAISAIKLRPTYLYYITPEGIIDLYGATGASRTRDKILQYGYGFINYTRHEDKYFNEVAIPTCDWLVKFAADTTVKFLSPPSIIVSIFDKVISYPKKLKLNKINPHVRKHLLTDSGTMAYKSGKKIVYTNEPLDGVGVLKLVFPISCKYESMFITTHPCIMLNTAIDITSEHEGEVIMSYALSKLMRYMAMYWRRSSGFTYLCISSNLPDLRRDTLWTNEEVYQHFNLTQEEINHIENTIK
jgi:hypothetical protein